jgi:predicted DCC family thiol-disulfide oxidoreductase YuxK
MAAASPAPQGRSGPTPLSPDVGRLTVVYDPDGAFCAWCRAWLEHQPLLVPVRFSPVGGPEAVARLGVLGTGAELVVVAEDGRAWTGAAAFVMCLWATARHRDLASALRLPVARMGAEAFFHAVSAHHGVLDRLLDRTPTAHACSQVAP